VFAFSPLQLRGQETTALIVRIQYWKERRLLRGHHITGAQQSLQSGLHVVTSEPWENHYYGPVHTIPDAIPDSLHNTAFPASNQSSLMVKNESY